jgi:hypothetical protein
MSRRECWKRAEEWFGGAMMLLGSLFELVFCLILFTAHTCWGAATRGGHPVATAGVAAAPGFQAPALADTTLATTHPLWCHRRTAQVRPRSREERGGGGGGRPTGFSGCRVRLREACSTTTICFTTQSALVARCNAAINGPCGNRPAAVAGRGITAIWLQAAAVSDGCRAGHAARLVSSSVSRGSAHACVVAAVGPSPPPVWWW